MQRSTILKLLAFTLLSTPLVILTVLMPPAAFVTLPGLAAFAGLSVELVDLN